MAINQETISDASRAIAFASDVAGLYGLVAQMRQKIERYIVGSAAIDANAADAREEKFVRLVQAIVDADDLTRIGALMPLLIGLQTELETNYDDFINPV